MNAITERFVAGTPITVMAQLGFERVLDPACEAALCASIMDSVMMGFVAHRTHIELTSPVSQRGR